MLSGTNRKQQYFNQYWQSRDLPSADARSRQRQSLVRTLLPEVAGQRLLEVGCGRGVIMEGLAVQGYKVCGCDIASDVIANLKADGFDVFLCDLERDPLPGKYDIVLCLEVLQQIFDPIAALIKMKDALKRGGCMVISVPNEFHIFSRLKLLVGRSHLGHFDESHIRLFTPRRARLMFERAGIEIESAIAVPVVPPRLGLLLPIGKLMAWLWPSLFAISNIYRLKDK